MYMKHDTAVIPAMETVIKMKILLHLMSAAYIDRGYEEEARASAP